MSVQSSTNDNYNDNGNDDDYDDDVGPHVYHPHTKHSFEHLLCSFRIQQPIQKEFLHCAQTNKQALTKKKHIKNRH